MLHRRNEKKNILFTRLSHKSEKRKTQGMSNVVSDINWACSVAIYFRILWALQMHTLPTLSSVLEQTVLIQYAKSIVNKTVVYLFLRFFCSCCFFLLFYQSLAFCRDKKVAFHAKDNKWERTKKPRETKDWMRKKPHEVFSWKWILKQVHGSIKRIIFFPTIVPIFDSSVAVDIQDNMVRCLHWELTLWIATSATNYFFCHSIFTVDLSKLPADLACA